VSIREAGNEQDLVAALEKALDCLLTSQRAEPMETRTN
jgi:hypothetical protein